MSWTQDPREDREASSASPSRGFGRWFSDLASAGREVKRVAKETRDAMVLLRHSAKHGDQQARPAEGLSQSLRVEVLSASDLSYVKSLPVPYCVVVTGYPDQTWGKKLGRECKTAPALRQRHPRWNALCHVAFPPEQVSASRVDFQKPDAAAPSADPPELCVRVLDAGGLRGDRLCGEARVPLRGRRGAGTFRLLGGGYATVSLRWSDRRGEIQLTEVSPEDEAFERACAFWARHDLGDLAGVTHAQLELAAMLATEPNGSRSAQLQMNEIILQAPLSALLLNHLDPREIQGLEVQSPGSHSLMTVLSEHLHLFTPLAGSRLVGALVERLPMVRGSVTLEDPCYLVVQRCAEAWEDFLLKIFLHFRGKELLELKRLVDAAGGGRDLRNTVYTVITHEARRAALLKHFEEEAERLEDFPLHILADIDQTVFVGTFGAGGPKFPTGPVPGALALFRALGGRVTFLSARPPIWEGQTRRLLDEIGIAEAVVLPGSLKAIAQVLYAPEQAKVAMAERKTEVFGQFATLHPEAQFIFIGDSGEGDIDFAEEFMAASRTRNLRRPPRAALIHDVARADGIVPKSNAARRNELRMRGIHVFDTYAGAALELFMLGLLDGEGLRQSAHGCLEEFGEIDVVEFASNEVFETRRMELLRDVREVNAAMRSAEQWRLRSGSAAGACDAGYPEQEAASFTASASAAAPLEETKRTVAASQEHSLEEPEAADGRGITTRRTAPPQREERNAEEAKQREEAKRAEEERAEEEARKHEEAKKAEELSSEVPVYTDLLGSAEETPSMSTAVAAAPGEEQQPGLAATEPPSKELETVDLLGSTQETPSMPTAVAATPAEEQQVGLAAKEPETFDLLGSAEEMLSAAPAPAAIPPAAGDTLHRIHDAATPET